MATETTLNQLNGYAKDLWTKLVNLVPDDLRLTKALPFDQENIQGGTYKQGVVLSEEAGFTHAAAKDGAVSLNQAVSLESDEATVNGYQVALVGSIDYESAERASSSKKAYKDIVGVKQANMFLSARKRVEGELWWGQKGIGKIASWVDAGTTESLLTITAAEHAPFLWAGKKNHQLVVYNGTTQVGGTYTVTAVNVSPGVRTVKVSGTAGDITTLETAVTANANVLDMYWFSAAQGASLTHKSCLGLMGIASTSAGSLFGLSTDFDLWRPNQYNVAGAPSFQKFLEAGEEAMSRGVSGKYIVDVSIKAFRTAMQDQAALRRFGGTEKQLANGAKSVEFQIGEVVLSVEPTGWMKQSYGLCRPGDGLKRIGARDVSFARPGNHKGPGENVFYDEPSKMAYSYRIWSHQAPFSEEPAKLIYLYGMTFA
jgi:hypothetical protein